MSTSLTRRSLVAATPVAVVVAAVPAIAACANSDAHLFDLGHKWQHLTVLAAEADRQCSVVSKIHDRACPDVTPEALFVRPDDDLALRFWPEKRKGKPTGRHVYGPVDIQTAEAALSVLPEQELLELLGGDDPRTKATLTRHREIVKSYRSDQETRHAALHAYGVREAEEAAEAAHDRYRDVALEIALCPARTLAGVLLKVRVAMHCFGDTLDEAEAQIDGVMEEMMTGESVALSIVKDLARIAERGSLGGLHA